MFTMHLARRARRASGGVREVTSEKREMINIFIVIKSVVTNQPNDLVYAQITAESKKVLSVLHFMQNCQ